MPQTLHAVLTRTDWATLARLQACLAQQIQADRATFHHLQAEEAHAAADLALEQAVTLSDLLAWVEAVVEAASEAGYPTHIR